MSSYHLRRAEKAITDEAELFAIIRGQQYVTLALCRENEPYLVTLNYGFDAEARCLYFHCATEGKKMDFLRANPVVWGQILEDNGYLPGQCTHAFRCVEFRGSVAFLETNTEKRLALTVMIEQLEPDPEPVKARTLTEQRVAGVTIGRIQIETLTGKQNESKKS